MSDALEYYKILEISPDASDEEIRTSYRNKAKIWHPDSNPSPEAAEMFRKLSEAHTVLTDNKLRNRYNLLSLCCTADNYPQTSNLAVIKDGAEDVNLRAVRQKVIRAKIIDYESKNAVQVVNYANALKLNFNNSLTNWTLGWWHLKTFVPNLLNIIHNFCHPLAKQDSCRILLTNMLAHEQSGQLTKAAQCGLIACDYLDASGQQMVKNYLSAWNVPLSRPRPWNLSKLLLSQLVAPIALIAIIAIIFMFGCNNRLFNGKKSTAINYYQSVDLGSRGSVTDDIVVGKVINIPVNKNDDSKLYHFKKAAKIMYGPSDKFDLLKTAEKDMTVRLTGITPDNIWARVMIDNGEMGFVHMDAIQQGRGAEIPFGSKITGN